MILSVLVRVFGLKTEKNWNFFKFRTRNFFEFAYCRKCRKCTLKLKKFHFWLWKFQPVCLVFKTGNSYKNLFFKFRTRDLVQFGIKNWANLSKNWKNLFVFNFVFIYFPLISEPYLQNHYITIWNSYLLTKWTKHEFSHVSVK